jgi:hypothetical protein
MKITACLGTSEGVTGGTRETGAIGQLNPDYSRWLQGFPVAWANCAAMAMHSVRQLRKRSSKRTSK